METVGKQQWKINFNHFFYFMKKYLPVQIKNSIYRLLPSTVKLPGLGCLLQRCRKPQIVLGVCSSQVLPLDWNCLLLTFSDGKLRQILLISSCHLAFWKVITLLPQVEWPCVKWHRKIHSVRTEHCRMKCECNFPENNSASSVYTDSQLFMASLVVSQSICQGITYF